MSIIVMSGVYPPAICGVGDYASKLLQAPVAKSWKPFTTSDWRLWRFPRIFGALSALNPSFVFVQYPTHGYGWSIAPHLLLIGGKVLRRFKGALVLHEFSQLSWRAQLCLAVTSHFCAHILFTSHFEQERARASFLFSRRVRSSAIGIRSNIPVAPGDLSFEARPEEIGYFGHIWPRKGLETFLDVVAELKLHRPQLRAYVMGQCPAGHEQFLDMVRARCAAAGIELILDLPDAAVAERLAETKILYLPFPDGISERRGSALAGMANGALIATTLGPFSTARLGEAVLPCSGESTDWQTLWDHLDAEPAAMAARQEQARSYLGAFVPESWDDIARAYLAAIPSSSDAA